MYTFIKITFVYLGMAYLAVSLSQAQTPRALEFYDTKYITLSGNSTSSGISATQTITVPTGRVWKIVNAAGSRKDNPTSIYGAGMSPVYVAFIMINDVRISSQALADASVGFDASSRLPIWLPSGTYTIKLGGTVGNSSTTVLSGFINAIEFLVVNKN